MRIEYVDEDTKKKYENIDTLSRLFGKNIVSSYNKFKLSVEASENLYKLGQMRRGLNIEKLKGSKYLYSARLNNKYRVEFKVDKELIVEIKDIKVLRIHPHTY